MNSRLLMSTSALLLTLIAAPLQAAFGFDWPSVLNNDNVSLDLQPQVATDDSGIWVAVWESADSLAGLAGFDSDIHFSRSFDGGVTWSASDLLNDFGTDDSVLDRRPQVATDGSGTWMVVWDSQEDLNGTADGDYDILYSRSTNGGMTWSAAGLLNSSGISDGVYDDFAPQVVAGGPGVWVVAWDSEADLGSTVGNDRDILFSRSTNDGLTWSDAALLNTNGDSDVGGDFSPQLSTDGLGNWGAVWLSLENLGGTAGVDHDIFFSRSTDDGETWSSPVLLNTNGTADSGADEFPDLSTDGMGNWVAVWQSLENLGGTAGGDSDILFSRSTDDGETWSAPILLNTNGTADTGSDDFPQLTTDGAGKWIAVWQSEEDLNGTAGTDRDIFISLSLDAGVTWSDPELLNANGTGDTGVDRYPMVACDDSGEWVAVWNSKEDLGGTAGTDEDIFVSSSTTVPVEISVFSVD